MNLEWLYTADENIFFFFNKTCHTAGLDTVAMFASRSGDGMFFFVVGLFLVLMSGRRNRISGLVLMAALTATYHVTHVMKAMIARPRPFLVLPEANALMVAGDFSMPSNHAATAFAAAFILTKYYGKGYVFYPLAVLVAISRVYIGVHFPSDVIAGSCLGLLIGYVLTSVADSVSAPKE